MSNLVQDGTWKHNSKRSTKKNMHQGYVRRHGIYAGYKNHRKLGPLVPLSSPLY